MAGRLTSRPGVRAWAVGRGRRRQGRPGFAERRVTAASSAAITRSPSARMASASGLRAPAESDAERQVVLVLPAPASVRPDDDVERLVAGDDAIGRPPERGLQVDVPTEKGAPAAGVHGGHGVAGARNDDSQGVRRMPAAWMGADKHAGRPVESARLAGAAEGSVDEQPLFGASSTTTAASACQTRPCCTCRTSMTSPGRQAKRAGPSTKDRPSALNSGVGFE